MLAAASPLAAKTLPSDDPAKRHHRAFKIPVQPAVPQISEPESRIATPPDAFILARLEKQGLSLSPEADPVTLCRRLYLDLTGLPPSPEEVDQSISDGGGASDFDIRASSFSASAGRLLASPHYGEKRARHWLDAARYADSDGYEKEVKFAGPAAGIAPPPETPVIAAFNEKIPVHRVLGPAGYAFDGKDDTAWSNDIGPGRRNRECEIVFLTDKPLTNVTGLTLHLKMNHGGYNPDDLQGNNPGRFRLSIAPAADAEIAKVPHPVRAALAVPPERRSPAQLAVIFSHWRTLVPEWKEPNDKIDAIWKEHPEGASNYGCGFLPTSHAGVPFRGSGDPVLFLSNPPGVDAPLQKHTVETIARMNQQRLGVIGDPEIAARINSYELAYRMQQAAPEIMDLSREPQHVLDLYGAEPGKQSYANACLLSRRLLENGVRFVQIFHEAWDHHGGLVGGLKEQCGNTDKASAALVRDLKQRGLLDDTLVIWGGEFGRTPMVQGGSDGRDHHPNAFSMWFAGGGIKPGITLGESDEFCFNATVNKVHVHDLHATRLHLLGFHHTKLTVRSQGRDFRLTDVFGEVVEKMLA